MAGFEVVVRPMVFPNIRPTPTRVLPLEDDPSQGFAVITGNGAKVVDLPYSWSMSASKTKPVETERRVDEVRTYQKDDKGNINKANFIDTEVANRINMTGETAPAQPVTVGPNIYTGDLQVIDQYYYQKQADKDTGGPDNVEILKRDQIRRVGDK